MSGTRQGRADSPEAEESNEILGRVEAELAFQGDSLRQLSDALATQQLDILTLQTQVRHLNEQLKALREEAAAPGAGSDLPEPPPPHY